MNNQISFFNNHNIEAFNTLNNEFLNKSTEQAGGISSLFFDNISQESTNQTVPSPWLSTKKKIKKIKKEEIDYKKINLFAELYISSTASERITTEILESKCVVHFEGKFLDSILTQGYKHWSQLPNTKNTSTIELFVERLHSEYNTFNINKYNKNILDKCNVFFNNKKQYLISCWNEYFNTDFNTSNISIANDLFKKTDFVFTNEYYGIVFGCLYFKNKLIQHKENSENYINKMYGKSRLILKDEFAKKNATFCLGDTFDAVPVSYAWKNNQNIPINTVLFDLEDSNDITLRLMSCLKESLAYVENHIYSPIYPDNIEKIIINKNEWKDVDVDLKKEELYQMYKIPIEVEN